jgi:Spx/MgsR family transcriptional regulator
MAVTVHGIPNCDTVKKARAWLAAHGVAHRFHDVRRDGLPAALLDGWMAAVGWERLLNRSGTTFRGLPEADRADLDAVRARALMLAHPTLIRRPVVSYPGGVLVGFAADPWARAFGV